MLNILAVIPAKAESRRLPNKNMQLINGKTLIEIAIEYAKSSSAITNVVVSTDSFEIKRLVESQYSCDCVIRGPGLVGEADVTEVYYHAWKSMGKVADYVVGIQPDHPDRKLVLDDVINYVLDKKLDDLITVDANGQKNGSVRMLKCPFNSRWHAGALMDDCTNIHTQDDLRLAQNFMPDNINLYKLPFGKFILRNTDMISQYLIRGEFWDSELKLIFDQYVQPGYNCIDVGANLGFYSVYMSHLVGKTGKVYAIEPIEHIFHQLCGNLFANKCYNTSAMNIAAYNKPCSMMPCKRKRRIIKGDINFDSVYNISQLAFQRRKKGHVLAVPLDSVINDDVNISFIKVDAQGCDLRALTGMKRIIANSRPTIVFEYEPKLSKIHKDYWKDYKHFFKKRKYKIKQLSSSSITEGNFLCVPR